MVVHCLVFGLKTDGLCSITGTCAGLNNITILRTSIWMLLALVSHWWQRIQPSREPRPLSRYKPTVAKQVRQIGKAISVKHV